MPYGKLRFLKSCKKFSSFAVHGFIQPLLESFLHLYSMSLINRRPVLLCLLPAALSSILFIVTGCSSSSPKDKPVPNNSELSYAVPDIASLPADSNGNLIRYGQQLMYNTAYNIGPTGINGNYTVSRTSCSNCHQQAGTKPFAFDLMTAYSRYPQYRAREDKVLSLAERVNNCVTRPLNGRPIPENSREMHAFLSYFKWLDNFATQHHKENWAKSLSLNFLSRAADTVKGAWVYASRCSRCHGLNGEGRFNGDSIAYQYPPLWGSKAYQAGSSMYRVIKMSGWLKANMPYDSARYDKPVLTDEEAFDVAAYINSRPRTHPRSFDYPRPDKKPVDHDRGPYLDSFSALQHKYGPYQPIIDYWNSKGIKPSY